ncbi:hypothetical protein GQ43DRAFT_439122 [Delitschia confertaspora ATCC 74209]|uniref:CBF1-interacting co-repressor CIR N-terminal domain-containing protein n=1 Tax=Delitschia confertaspora ATCC 74209 TaxID=1513339 RepID=A0A9P4JP56_9PLEO|nr:hypothetical protein GQ43DRAFT_439122 [Delitschia confertaspora ATCC 74209]
MPLHLLGKKSWNVYNSANVAKVKADIAAAEAREAEEERQMQELEAERRAAILRGRTPPPLPDIESKRDEKHGRRSGNTGLGGGRKHRRLAGEDDTDRDIRLAKDVTAPQPENDAAKFRLRNPNIEASLTDPAGHINLFPIDEKAAIQREKRERNADAEAEKKKKERELEDQYTMRFSNAAGREGLHKQPWYAGHGFSGMPQEEKAASSTGAMEFPGLENKDVWGREDPRRKEREQARISANDPLLLVRKGVAKTNEYNRKKKEWEMNRLRELQELEAQQEEEDRRERHSRRKSHHEKHRSSRHRQHRDRSRSKERRDDRRRSRSPRRDRADDREKEDRQDKRRRSRSRRHSRHHSRRHSHSRSPSRSRSRSRSPGRERDRARDRHHRKRPDKHRELRSYRGERPSG